MIRTIKDIMLKLRVKLYNILGCFFTLFPIQDNKIVVVNMFGRNPGDNLEPVTEHLSNNKSLDIVWLVKDLKNSTLNTNYRFVKYGSLNALKELATAKIWLDNARKEFYPPKRKNQKYYQFWHGGLGIKKIERDAISSLSNFYVWLAKKDSEMVDYMISNSSHLTNLYKNSFWYNGEVLEYGYPKEVKLIQESINRNRKRINSSKAIKILYAPTFRDYPYDPMDFDFTKLQRGLSEYFNKPIELYLRPHPINKTKSYFKHLSSSVVDASKVGNIQDLIVDLDVLITDYSSIMFDSLIAGVKTILYVPDKDRYMSKRGSYFSLEELPFPVVSNAKSLFSEIIEESDSFWKQRKTFLKKTGYIEALDSCKKISNHILKNMNK